MLLLKVSPPNFVVKFEEELGGKIGTESVSFNFRAIWNNFSTLKAMYKMRHHNQMIKTFDEGKDAHYFDSTFWLTRKNSLVLFHVLRLQSFKINNG